MSGIARAFTTRKVKMSLDIAQEAKDRAAAKEKLAAAKEKAAAKERAIASMQRINASTKTSTKTSTKPASLTKPPPARSNSAATRSKISGPIELIHTTNMLSYNAPDLPRPSTSSQGSTKSSTHTDDDSDSAASTAASSPPTSPDVPSSELKRSSSSPEPNHLSTYFMPGTPVHIVPSTTPPPPAIPQRAPSHTKQASIDAVSRQRSNSIRMMKEPQTSNARSNSGFTRTLSTATASSARSQESARSQASSNPSNTSVATTAPSLSSAKPQLNTNQHPFGSELAQVTEIAEEFGVRDKLHIIDEEERELMARGLGIFSADDYLREIEDLRSIFFGGYKMASVVRPAPPPAWI